MQHAHDSHIDTNGCHVRSQPGEGIRTSHYGIVVWPRHTSGLLGAGMAGDSSTTSYRRTFLDDLETTLQAWPNTSLDPSRRGAFRWRTCCEEGLDIVQESVQEDYQHQGTIGCVGISLWEEQGQIAD